MNDGKFKTGDIAHFPVVPPVRCRECLVVTDDIWLILDSERMPVMVANVLKDSDWPEKFGHECGFD